MTHPDTPDAVQDGPSHRLPRSFFARRGYRLVGAGFGNPESRVAWLLRKAKRLRPAYEGLPRLFPSLGISLVAYKDK